MFSKLKNKSVRAKSDFRDLEQKSKKLHTQKPQRPQRPNPMAYRAVSRQSSPSRSK